MCVCVCVCACVRVCACVSIQFDRVARSVRGGVVQCKSRICVRRPKSKERKTKS